MCGAIPPHPLHGRGWGYERASYRREKPTKWCNLKEKSFAIAVITIKCSLVGWASRQRGLEKSGVAAECVDPRGSSRQKFERREFHTA